MQSEQEATIYTRFEVLMAMWLGIQVFCDLTFCHRVSGSQHPATWQGNAWESWKHKPGVRTIKVGSVQNRVAAITKLVPEYMLLTLTGPNTNVK